MSEVDLHTHSTASDGTLTPTELIKKARNTDLKAIALTDHDTTNGLHEAINAGKEKNIELIPGCELSVNYTQGQMHILGLWLPELPKKLNEKLQYLRDMRHHRNEEIINKLQSLSIDIDYQEVKELAGQASVGRPHIARILLRKQAISNFNEAFAQYLGPQGKAYVPRQKLTPKESISILKEEKATVILAHPYSLKLTEEELISELTKLKEYGLDGIEVLYSEHTKQQMNTYLNIAKKLELLVSGGSDYHGTRVNPDIRLGIGKGNLNLPYDIVSKMKYYRKSQGLWTT